MADFLTKRDQPWVSDDGPSAANYYLNELELIIPIKYVGLVDVQCAMKIADKLIA